MKESLELLLLGVALCAGMRLAHRFLGLLGVVALSVVCMTRLSITAGVAVTMFGFHSNFGNVLYVPVIFGTALCARSAPQDAWRQIIGVFIGLVAATALLAVVQGFALADSELLGHLRAIGTVNLRIVTASCLAFIIANGVCLAVTASTRHPLLAQIAAQAADSLLFFPIAFSDAPGFPLLATMADGFAIKCLIVLASAPLLLGGSGAAHAANAAYIATRPREDGDDYFR